MNQDFYSVLAEPVALISDYDDYYDEFFKDLGDTDELLFPRLLTGLPSYKKRLDLLRSWDAPTVPYGKIEDLANAMPIETFEVYDEHTLVIDHIYVAVYAKGSDKLPKRLPIMEATESYPNNFGVLCLEIEEDVVYRHVRIGRREFCLRLKDGTSVLLEDGTGPKTQAGSNSLYPMAVIDFVKSLDSDVYYAIDYAPAIMLAGTPIEKVLSKEEAAFEIKQWILNSEEMIAELLGGSNEV